MRERYDGVYEYGSTSGRPTWLHALPIQLIDNPNGNECKEQASPALMATDRAGYAEGPSNIALTSRHADSAMDCHGNA